MNRAERLTSVLAMLARDGQVDVTDIVDELDVSPATARRDLEAVWQTVLGHHERDRMEGDVGTRQCLARDEGPVDDDAAGNVAEGSPNFFFPRCAPRW